MFTLFKLFILLPLPTLFALFSVYTSNCSSMYIVREGYNVIEMGSWASEQNGVECMDAPETVMATRAPAVLNKHQVFLPGEDQC